MIDTDVYLKDIETIGTKDTFSWLCSFRHGSDEKRCCKIKIGEQGFVKVTAISVWNRTSDIFACFNFYHRYLDIGEWYFKDWLMFEVAVKEFDISMKRKESYDNYITDIANHFHADERYYKETCSKNKKFIEDKSFKFVVYAGIFNWEPKIR